jgi:ubiquinone/menaquinone biosynthesis C-methylase UbiE
MADSRDAFESVTELAGEPVSAEQIERMHHRYKWAANLAAGCDVAEVACGSGPGLGLLAGAARSLEAGDLSPAILARARRHYGLRVKLDTFGAESLPYGDASKDVLILFEAIYYLRDASRFVAECRRVLRRGGRVLIATANKDLADFNPSPYSQRYYGVVELAGLFARHGFACEFFGYLSTETVSLKQRLLRPVKRLVVRLGLMPKTMAGKRLLKRIIFGPQVPMPAELRSDSGVYNSPTALAGDQPDLRHKVIYCVATLTA